MARRTLALAACLPLLALLAQAQQVGNNTAEVHPRLTTWKCTSAGGCSPQNTSVVIDANYRWLHTVGGHDSCSTPSGDLNATLCPDAATCARNCALEGVNYTASGVHTASLSGNNASTGSLTLDMYVNGNGVSPRLYLLGPDDEYVDLRLVGQELTFDVDVSKLPCGMNGALYLSEMSMSGGKSGLNRAGAAMGTGYCDAQCPVSNFLNGEANTNRSGACCNEMDIWEANGQATAFTPHTCSISGVYACQGAACGGDGVCDKGGCGFNAYAQGSHSFYEPSHNATGVDTTRPFTVVTQFINGNSSSSNSSAAQLTEIRRLYVQNGKVVQNARVASGSGNSITDAFCGADTFEKRGGLKGMGEALQRGMVLIFSIWNDGGQFMHWLDSGSSGPCNATVGDPAFISAHYPDTSVTFSNIKWGDIGSTYTAK